MPKLFIKHRVNTIAELGLIHPQWGVEIDLRSSMLEPGHLHLQHDAWLKGEDFDRWLKEFSKKKITGPLVLNTKEDGLEEEISAKLKIHQINHYLFLDTTTPTLIKKCGIGNQKHFFIRLSSFEPPAFALEFKGKSEWLWIDCFEGEPVPFEWLEELAGVFKFCLVSPELHGVNLTHIENFRRHYSLVDAVCTKDPGAWIEKLGH